MSDKMKNLEYVRNSLPRRVLLEGLAEECCELAQAALKSIRADDGTNPTPVSKEACLDKLNEEAGGCSHASGASGYDSLRFNAG